MQVRIEDVSPVEKKLVVEVPWETVSQKLGDAYRELGKGVALKGFRKVEGAESGVDEAIGGIRREHTELRPMEGRTETAKGDVVALSVTGTIGEHKIEQPQFAVDLDDGEREPLPGLRAVLTGLPIDTKDKHVEIEVPVDHEDPDLRGRKASLTFTILEVRAKEVPALDDELAKDTGKADTLEAL